MTTLNKKDDTKSTPSGKPVKPKKPIPSKEESVKIPVPCSVLTEERAREIARYEIAQYMDERIGTVLRILSPQGNRLNP